MTGHGFAPNLLALAGLVGFWGALILVVLLIKFWWVIVGLLFVAAVVAQAGAHHEVMNGRK